jgi:hypothetical protein
MLEMSPQVKNEGAKYYFSNEVRKNELIVNIDKNYLTFKDFEGWKGQCYPTFKVYTRADGKQVLGVTEDSYTHHSYRSKYSYSAPTWSGGYEKVPFYKEEMKAIDDLYQADKIDDDESDKREAAVKNKAEAYIRERDPYHLWNARPRPIKFWTYEGGTWTEVTDQVMSEFFSLEQMIAKTTATPDEIKNHIIHHIYPLYRIEQDKNEITVWVDEARLKLYTTEIEEFASAGDNLEHRKNGSTANKVYWKYIENTTYKTYTLVWDDKAGKFVRKK